MIGAYASAAIVCAASFLAGRAILSIAGRGDSRLLAGPVGLAALLVASGLTTGLGGKGTAVWITIGVLSLLSGVRVWRFRGSSISRPGDIERSDGNAMPALLPPAMAAGVALLLASLPFIASGDVGLLGVGLVNDDMASHLLLADWIETGFRPEPVFVDQGYPLGPHSLVVGLSVLLGTGLIEAFAGMVLAVAVLAALTAYGALDGVRTTWRVLVAPLVALPYMVAAYFAQEAFKEPILALFVLGFALLLAATARARDAIPLGVLAAGVVFVYSFPGLAWLVGTAVVYGACSRFMAMRAAPTTGGKPRNSRDNPPTASGAFRGTLRPALVAAVAATAVLVALVAPDIGRVIDFADFRALDPDRANEGGLGNLRGHISPLEALGVWPTSEFRLSAGAGGLPAVAFYAGAALGLVALGIGLPRWTRRHGPAVPAALGAAIVIYAGARAFGTVYTSAKALAIAAPLITLIALGGLLAERNPDARGVDRNSYGKRHEHPRGRAVLAGLFALSALVSSFLILRQSPVAPTAHATELEQIRPLVQGENVLFLGRDNFVLYELRGSKPYTHVRNFYDPFFVEPNFELKRVGSKFDFDSVAAEKLERFPFVITTGAAYASSPPPEYELVLETGSYRLWERTTPAVGPRTPGETGPAPAGFPDCPGLGRRLLPENQQILPQVSGTATILPQPSVLGAASAWSPSPTVEGGETVSQSLQLHPGRYAISLSYDATRPVSVRAAGTALHLPANLDYRGVSPYWPAGEITIAEPGVVRFEATVERLPLAGRLLGADSVAHLGALAATPTGASGEPRERPLAEACGEWVDWIRADVE